LSILPSSGSHPHTNQGECGVKQHGFISENKKFLFNSENAAKFASDAVKREVGAYQILVLIFIKELMYFMHPMMLKNINT